MSLPDYLLEAHERSILRPTNVNMNILSSRLRMAAELYLKKDPQSPNAEFADIWLNCFYMNARYRNSYYVSPQDIKTVVSLLVDTNDANDEKSYRHLQENLRTALVREGNDQALAMICLKAIAYINMNSPTNLDGHVIDIVAVWSNEKLVPSTSLTIEKVTDLLYGPMVYTLYRPDVIDDALLPYTLGEQNVPVGGLSLLTKQVKSFHSAEVTLPSYDQEY